MADDANNRVGSLSTFVVRPVDLVAITEVAGVLAESQKRCSSQGVKETLAHQVEVVLRKQGVGNAVTRIESR